MRALALCLALPLARVVYKTAQYLLVSRCVYMLTGMPTVRNVRATDPRDNYPITPSPSIPAPMVRSDYDRTVTAGVNHNNVYVRAIHRKYVTLCMRHVTDTVMHINDVDDNVKAACYDRAVALVSSQTLRSGALRYRGCVNPITRKAVA